MDKKIDVTGRYRQELLDIKNRLNQLENDRYYEKSGVKMDGYLATNIQDDMSTPFWTYSNRTIYLIVYEFIRNYKIAFWLRQG